MGISVSCAQRKLTGSVVASVEETIASTAAVATAALPTSCLAVDQLVIGDVAYARDPVDYYYLVIAIVAPPFHGRPGQAVVGLGQCKLGACGEVIEFEYWKS